MGMIRFEKAKNASFQTHKKKLQKFITKVPRVIIRMRFEITGIDGRERKEERVYEYGVDNIQTIMSNETRFQIKITSAETKSRKLVKSIYSII